MIFCLAKATIIVSSWINFFLASPMSIFLHLTILLGVIHLKLIYLLVLLFSCAYDLHPWLLWRPWGLGLIYSITSYQPTLHTMVSAFQSITFLCSSSLETLAIHHWTWERVAMSPCRVRVIANDDNTSMHSCSPESGTPPCGPHGISSSSPPHEADTVTIS